MADEEDPVLHIAVPEMQELVEQLGAYELLPDQQEALANAIEVLDVGPVYLNEDEHNQCNGHHKEPTRFCKQIPVVIVNNNQDAMDYVNDAMTQGFLPPSGNTLIHVDLKPDLWVIPDFLAGNSFDPKVLNQCHGPGTWIVPNLFNTSFKKVIWVKPPWSEQLSELRYQFQVGNHIQSKFIRVNCKDAYFIADCSYAPSEVLEFIQTVSVDCVTIGNVLVASAEDHDHWREVCRDNHTVPTVLDIDLQFFSSCPLPAVIFESTDVIGKLMELFEFDLMMDSPNEIRVTIARRSDQLREIKEYFTHLKDYAELPFRLEPSQIHIEVQRIVAEFRRIDYPIEMVDWDTLYEYGCAAHLPPSHPFTPMEMEALYEALENFLDTLLDPPRLITISKSNVQNCDQILRRVLEILRAKFRCALPLNFDMADNDPVNPEGEVNEDQGDQPPGVQFPEQVPEDPEDLLSSLEDSRSDSYEISEV